MGKVIFWLQIMLSVAFCFRIITNENAALNMLDGYSILFFVLPMLASYGYAFQKIIWNNLIWKVLAVFQALWGLPAMFIISVWMLAYIDTTSLADWAIIAGIDALLILQVLPLYLYGFRSRDLW